MAQNNSSASASAAGTAWATGATLQKRAAVTPSPAPQLFGQRQRALRKSTSLKTDPKAVFPENSLTPSLSQSISLPHRPLPSLPRKVKLSDVAHSLILHRRLSNPRVPSKPSRLYRRLRNPKRALSLFLRRRQQWRRTRRPISNMNFIEHLRRIQADEASSDEESGLVLTSVSNPAPRRPSSASSTTSVVAPGQSDENKATGAAKKRDGAEEAAATEEASAKTSRAAKKAKGPESVGAKQPQAAKAQTTLPTAAAADGKALTNGVKSPKKRSRDDEKTEIEGERLRAAKKPKSEDRNQAESSRAAPAALAPREYFERRVHETLTDPLGFDDLVYNSNKPIPRHVARSFAQYRRRQTQPPPPLEMSGALGSAADAKPAAGKPKSPGSLAKEAQKRAHQQKVKEQVQGAKGFVGSKQAGVPKANATKGKGKERAWLTNARGKSGVKQGGRHHQPSVKKYNKSTYFDVPTK
ncbi:hypothetical protein C8A00DRAFT_12188 [Chaetomidium leptoderma]|uniref:Uncharacterized protein n=1 Tax=Chaetomidium leptoderma TaxID=669021 RepID=A0AAN6VSC1_9PEZI|nr:hypothetical protein C8A00DRAFT_12188 [Chaetomidium leptoderma]